MMLHLDQPAAEPEAPSGNDVDTAFIAMDPEACIKWPDPPKWRLNITPDFQICLAHRPSWWSRVWQRFFMGWTWEPIE